MKLSPTKSVKDWFDLRDEASKNHSPEFWNQIFDDYFYSRIQSRYLQPIDAISKKGCSEGEGFAIMSIICAMIEFLESLYNGVKYVNERDPKKLQEFEYNSSGRCFKSFLTTKAPFNLNFDDDLANSFYTNIRCGLLHEAATKGGWLIHRKNSNDKVLICGISKVIYRDNILTALNIYIDLYKKELLSNQKTKEAFIRKYNYLCE